MAGVLILGEVDRQGALTLSSLQLATAGRSLAQELNEPLMGALFGTDLQGAAQAFQCGLSTLYLAQTPALAPYSLDAYIDAARTLIEASNPSVVLFIQGAPAREWVPALAARMQAGLVTNCSALSMKDDALIATKPVNGGNVIGTFVISGDLRMVMIRTGAFSACEISANTSEVNVSLSLCTSSRVKILSEEFPDTAQGQRLKEARIVIAGGRGVGGESNWHYISEAARALCAAVGCSRPVAESGWIAPSQQVGLSGTSVAPSLYIAVGISGAPQHLAGITAAKVVAAINNDENADIFKRADFGVVDDFAEVLQGFTERIRQLRP